MKVSIEASTYIRDNNLSLNGMLIRVPTTSEKLFEKYESDVLIIKFVGILSSKMDDARCQIICDRHGYSKKQSKLVRQFIGSPMDDNTVEPLYGYTLSNLRETPVWFPITTEFLCRYSFDTRPLYVCSCCLLEMDVSPSYVCEDCESTYCLQCTKNEIAGSNCNCGVLSPSVTFVECVNGNVILKTYNNPDKIKHEEKCIENKTYSLRPQNYEIPIC